MKNRSIKTAIGLGLLMLPAIAALADAPIVQGHNPQPGMGNSVSVTTPATSPVDASATTQTPNQALVSGVSDDPSAALSNNPLDLGNQIAMMEQEIQDLRGQLEMQGHKIAQLQNRVAQLSTNTPNVPVPAGLQPTNSPAPAPAPMTDTDTSQASSNTPVSSASAPAPASTAITPLPAPASNTATQDQSEAQMYQHAYDLMAAKQYNQATVGLQTYLQQYPVGQYAANAHYWLGELGLIAGNTQQAQSQFAIVIGQFAQSPKAPDSMLKLGMIYSEQANWKAAKTQFNAVIKQYPNTTTAQLAQQQLQQIQQSGN